MPKNKVIVDVVNGAVPLGQSLRRLEVLTHDVGNAELEHWWNASFPVIALKRCRNTGWQEIA